MKKRKLRKSEVTYLDASFVSFARTLLYLLQISCHDCSVGQDLTASAPQAAVKNIFLCGDMTIMKKAQADMS